jgi:hypothetical protein
MEARTCEQYVLGELEYYKKKCGELADELALATGQCELFQANLDALLEKREATE